MSLREQWWRTRYAFHFMRIVPCSIRFAIASAMAADYDPDTSPRDSVWDELSYWEDDER